MAGYTIRALEEIPDVLGDYPGEMRMSAASDLGTEQVGFTWRRMPPLTGGKGSYGHRHLTQEEVYFVASGTLQFKLEDEIVDVPEGTVVRVAPDVARSVWNAGPGDAVLIIVSKKSEDPREDTEQVEDFWPNGEEAQRRTAASGLPWACRPVRVLPPPGRRSGGPCGRPRSCGGFTRASGTRSRSGPSGPTSRWCCSRARTRFESCSGSIRRSRRPARAGSSCGRSRGRTRSWCSTATSTFASGG